MINEIDEANARTRKFKEDLDAKAKQYEQEISDRQFKVFLTTASERVFDWEHERKPRKTFQYIEKILSFGNVLISRQETYCDYKVVDFDISLHPGQENKGLPPFIDLYARLDFLFNDIDEMVLEIYDLLSQASSSSESSSPSK